MSYYLHNVEMPFSGKNISFREIKNKEQIAISKANLAMPIDNNEPVLYNNFLKKIIFQCVENQEVLKELNVIEYILFAAKLRIVSFGSNLELQQDVEEADNKKNVKKIKITLDLQTFIKNLFDASKHINSTVIKFQGMEIILSWPNHKDQDYFLNLKETNSMLSSFCYFIKTIKMKDKIINMWDFSNTEREEIFDSFSISIRSKIQNKITDALQILSSGDLFTLKQLNDYKFSFYNTVYLDILRLFYSFDLKEIYREYYALASRQIPPSYINDISTIERKLYLSIMQEERSASNKQDTPSGESSLLDLAREFGDQIPN